MPQQIMPILLVKSKEKNSVKKLVIIGAGGFGREVAWLTERINKVNETWHLMGFLDDNKKIHGSIVEGYPVLGGIDWIKSCENEVYFVCAIASSKVRRDIIHHLSGVRFATVIDPSVIISNRVKIGEGCIICAGTIITVDIEIGTHVIINWDCTVGHDAKLHDFTTLYPSVNISGGSELEECAEMGTGSQIIQGLKIGEGSFVGAGAVVVREIPKECTAVGCPAKPIKFHTGY